MFEYLDHLLKMSL